MGSYSLLSSINTERDTVACDQLIDYDERIFQLPRAVRATRVNKAMRDNVEPMRGAYDAPRAARCLRDGGGVTESGIERRIEDRRRTRYNIRNS